MSENILVLTGSPRRGGNSDTLADAFIRGAEKNKNKITKINLAEKKISGCRACNGCWVSRGNCVVDDDMKELEPLLESADVLVVATPIYWSMVPAQVKAPLDRLYEYDPVHGGKHLHIKEAILLTCGETDDAEDFMMIKTFFNMIADFNGMKVRDIIAVPGVNMKGDINGNDALVQAEKLGLSIGA
ncbi:flavodoxin family protein [Ruminococcus gauvreauii]|uniref:Flavodoxin family protein n=1 Tax=Ruminococcus gauvreauii TaxID=438033 RepID=A0ABY5VD63_9FIRM|nr:flavodoxin family protein [Ruminococcus gauvreauii]UWP58108.1 flavodoxin family protein [Ruminococcus gauvreauii]